MRRSPSLNRLTEIGGVKPLEMADRNRKAGWKNLWPGTSAGVVGPNGIRRRLLRGCIFR